MKRPTPQKKAQDATMTFLKVLVSGIVGHGMVDPTSRTNLQNLQTDVGAGLAGDCWQKTFRRQGRLPHKIQTRRGFCGPALGTNARSWPIAIFAERLRTDPWSSAMHSEAAIGFADTIRVGFGQERNQTEFLATIFIELQTTFLQFR